MRSVISYKHDLIVLCSWLVARRRGVITIIIINFFSYYFFIFYFPGERRKREESDCARHERREKTQNMIGWSFGDVPCGAEWNKQWCVDGRYFFRAFSSRACLALNVPLHALHVRKNQKSSGCSAGCVHRAGNFVIRLCSERNML